MEYKLYKDGILLSRLGMGAMRLPLVEGDSDKIIDEQKAQAMIDECMAKGINYYDTAYVYHNGQSEVFLGKALASYPRESFYLADKFNIHANPDYKAQFEDQLLKLGVDYIDFYLLHGVADDNANTFLTNGCIEYFLSQKEAGRIKYFGFSFHGKPEVLQKVVDDHKWDFVQIQLNYYDWYYGTAKAQYEIISKKNIPIMVMEPVHGGMLANLDEEANAFLKACDGNVSIASWAMRFVQDLDDVQVVLSGMTHMDQVLDNIKTFSENKPLSADEQKAIQKACQIVQAKVAVPCTGCRYCVGECPKGLDIPYLLQLYNEYKLGGVWRLRRLSALDKDKRPSACIGCGQCVKQCPQSIDIPKYMKEMAEESKL